jgi:N-acyl-D-amino-acid deacylase
MRRDWAMQVRHPVPWSTLGEYFDHLEGRGISPNVASFVSAGVVRRHVMGVADRDPTAAEVDRMESLVRQSMREGAVGVTCAMIYPPCSYVRTDDLVALARVAAEHDGMLALHLRSEGARLLEGVDEILHVARSAGVRAEIYHLKALGESNWEKLERAFAAIEAARADGVRVTADVYPYTAGWTGLDASMPGWVQEGGLQEWIRRLRDPAVRERLKREMSTPGDWDNWLLAAGSPDRVLLVGFRTDSLQPLTGKTLADVAARWRTSPEEAAMDLVVRDGSRVMAVYFVMSEENVRRAMELPWVSFGSDEGAIAPERPFLGRNPHPRAYGTFARVLGRYVRDEKVLPLEEAVRRLTSFPAENLRLRDRGRLAPGTFADVVVFDPATVADHATYEDPHRYATGVLHVFVNGVQVLKDGGHTGAKPGRVVRGPGWTGWTAPPEEAEDGESGEGGPVDRAGGGAACVGLGCGDSVPACVGMGCPE